MTTVLFIASLIWLMNTNRVNNSLEAGLQTQKLKSESLLSEKLLLEKDIDKFKSQLTKMTSDNAELDRLLRHTKQQLSDQESSFNRMKRENATLSKIKKQRQQLEALKNQLENDLSTLKHSYDALVARNNELHNTVASLEARNKVLTDDLNRAMFASIDHSQIQAVRGKSEELTVKGKRTRKLIANFELPAHFKNLTFRIADSNGTFLSNDKGTLAFTATPSDKSITASADPTVDAHKLQNVEVVYVPKEKLSAGTNTIEILNENLYVGSLKVKLK